MTLFHDGVEDYATANTTLVSEEVQSIAKDTNEAGLFAPCMVGTLESQFLKLQVNFTKETKICALFLEDPTRVAYYLLRKLLIKLYNLKGPKLKLTLSFPLSGSSVRS